MPGWILLITITAKTINARPISINLAAGQLFIVPPLQ